MKLKLQIIFILFSTYTFAQVGVGTTDPKSVFHIAESNTVTPTNTDGILIPRIDNFPTINPTADQNGMLVFLKTATLPASPFGANTIGFYYWSNPLTTWVGITTTKSNWLLTGNSFTIDGTNYIGTNDNVPLNFKINSLKAGRISTTETFYGYLAGNVNTGNENTAIGTEALRYNTTGNENTAIGRHALRANTTGNDNTAIGRQTLRVNTTGNENTAVGKNALVSNQTGDANTAIGRHALQANTIGFNNSAVGKSSLGNNTTGKENTAIGKDALRDNTIGEKNTAIGAETLINNKSGNQNTGIGFAAMFVNETGNENVAIGYDALRDNISGSDNTAIGKNALNSNTTGSNNTTIGYNSDVISSGLTNATAIGYNAIADASNMVRIGNTAVTSIKAQVGINITSDSRFKDNIKDITLGLNFIENLRPVEYTRKNDASNNKEWGVIAQELKATIEQLNYKNAGIISEDTTENHYLSVRYTDLIAPVIKAIQELSEKDKEIDSLKKKVESQDKLLNNLLKRIEDLEKQ